MLNGQAFVVILDYLGILLVSLAPQVYGSHLLCDFGAQYPLGKDCRSFDDLTEVFSI